MVEHHRAHRHENIQRTRPQLANLPLKPGSEYTVTNIDCPFRTATNDHLE